LFVETEPGRLVAFFLFMFSSVGVAIQAPAWGDETERSRDKISSIILAHQQQKVQPDGLSVDQHRERLRRLGLDAENLTAEQCALYVDGRLSEQEVAILKQQGISVNPYGWVPAVPGRHPHGFHIVTVPYDQLDSIRNNDRFIFLESVESTAYPLNTSARSMINADDVSAGNGTTSRTGAGVKIAIADSGIDLSHADFPTPIDAWDMTDGIDPNTWGTDVSNTVMDHGTHVTGSALGRGVLGPYQGAADGGDLYFYKIGNDINAGATDTDMIEALNRFITVGGSGPRIFSLSYGGIGFDSNTGSGSNYLDGSGPVCQAIDNATANGVTCIIAAGNEAWSNRHDSVSVAPGTTSPTFSYVVDNSGGTSAYNGTDDFRIIWRDGVPDDNAVLTCTNCAAGELIYTWSGVSSRGTEARQYWLDLSGNPLPAGASRTYNFQLQNTAGGGSTPLIHLYRYSGLGTFSSPDPSYTITYPAVADTAIAVGAWVQSNGWTDYEGNFWQYTWMFTNTLAPFSSLGPRVDGVQKPEFVAPGAVTISTRDSSTFGSPSGCDNGTGFPYDCLSIDNDGIINGAGPADYYVHYGTSMACPMAAGAAALMLEAAPTMTPAQVRAALMATSSNAASPNNNVGSGLLDILAAIQSVDCDGNGVYDVTEVGDGSAPDCDGNGRPDTCDIADGSLADCNANGNADQCDISSGDSFDCNTNAIPDECDLLTQAIDFGPEINSYLGTNFAGKMVAGDWDGSGIPDLMYVLPNTTVYVLLNNGDGTFQFPNEYNNDGGLTPTVSADLDEDGFDDLVSVGGAAQGVTVELSNGDGTFADPVAYAAAVDWASHAAVADMDRDGIEDIIMLEEGGPSVLPGNGDGTFGQAVLHSLGQPTSSVGAGDMDNDGYLDFVLTLPVTDEVAVMFNNADGTFASPVAYSVGDSPQRAAIADFDADGSLDLAVTNSNDFQTSQDDLSVLLNNGNGTFAAASHFDVSEGSLEVVAEDFNRDGVTDIAVGHSGWSVGAREFSILANNVDGTFELPVNITQPDVPFPGGSAFGDFDGDGDVDWAVHNSNFVSVFPDNADVAEQDCNANGTPDTCDIASGDSQDCQEDDIPDDCQLAGNDCNGNGEPDECDISGGGSSDNDGNGVPDECVGGNNCPADFDGDNDVDAADLAQLLGSWGSYGPCPPYAVEDFDQDCDVDAADLAQLLGAWGACP
jgi:subtilisin family serine protease